MAPNDSSIDPARLDRQGFTLDEIAAATPCSRRFIEAQIARGYLRAHKVGRKTLILREDWDAWIRSQPVDPS